MIIVLVEEEISFTYSKDLCDVKVKKITERMDLTEKEGKNGSLEDESKDLVRT